VYVFSAKKLGSESGDLLRKIIIDELFMTDMMYKEVLSRYEKQEIQEVCECIS